MVTRGRADQRSRGLIFVAGRSGQIQARPLGGFLSADLMNGGAVGTGFAGRRWVRWRLISVLPTPVGPDEQGYSFWGMIIPRKLAFTRSGVCGVPAVAQVQASGGRFRFPSFLADDVLFNSPHDLFWRQF